MIVSIIAALSENNVIGKQGNLPWHLPQDMAYFKKTTMGHHVVMGRKNFESIPQRFRPLSGRTNCVLSRSAEFLEKAKSMGVQGFLNIEETVAYAKNRGETELFVIGGGEIYTLALPLADRLYLTRVLAVVEGDTYFPQIEIGQWKLTSQTPVCQDNQHAFDFVFEVHWRKTIHHG